MILNFLGFENSEARNLMIETFDKIDFEYQEFLISPTQIGIPNSRLRYYAIGIKRGSNFKFDFDTKLCQHYGLIWI